MDRAYEGFPLPAEISDIRPALAGRRFNRAPDGATPAWTRAWYAWLAAFVVIEGSALARHRQPDTLSWHVWAWFGIKRHVAPAGSLRIRRLALLTFLAWLAAHFITGDEF